MTFGLIHDKLQSLSPLGAGFAVSINVIETLIRSEITTLTAPGGTGQNIAIIGFPTLSFSIELAPADFLFDAAGSSISVDKLVINIHIKDEPHSILNILEYKISSTPVKIQLTLGDLLSLIPVGPDTASITSQTDLLTPDLLSRAGYADSSGPADQKRKYLEEFYFGFLFITSRGIVRSIIASIPFPQVHQWLRGIRMVPPFNSIAEHGYIAVYSDLASLDVGQCASPSRPTQSSTSTSTSTFIAGSATPRSVLSPVDGKLLPYVIYSSAQVLVDWYAEAYAPAVLYSDGEGGFIAWSVDAAIGVKSFRLTFQPSATGGTLQADMGLRLLGSASAWFNGPSNSRTDITTVSVIADGNAQGLLSAELDLRTLTISYTASVKGSITPSTVRFQGGDIMGLIIAKIAGTLVNTGAIELKAKYDKRGVLDILDATKLGGHPGIHQRLSNTSAAIGISDNPDAI